MVPLWYSSLLTLSLFLPFCLRFAIFFHTVFIYVTKQYEQTKTDILFYRIRSVLLLLHNMFSLLHHILNQHAGTFFRVFALHQFSDSFSNNEMMVMMMLITFGCRQNHTRTKWSTFGKQHDSCFFCDKILVTPRTICPETISFSFLLS